MAAVSFLETHGLSRQFGGFTAVDNVDFALEQGEIRAVIGPNGAGKTTLVSMICGRVPPSAGAIRFEGDDITRLPPWERVARGIVYTFQITSVFRNLTCFDNVALAAQRVLTLGRRRGIASISATLARGGERRWSAWVCAARATRRPPPCPTAISACWKWPWAWRSSRSC